MKFSIKFAAMLNLVRQIKSSLNRSPSSVLLDITHAQYTYTYLLTGRISKLGLHSLKTYTCVRITSWITLVFHITHRLQNHCWLSVKSMTPNFVAVSVLLPICCHIGSGMPYLCIFIGDIFTLLGTKTDK